MLFSLQTKVSLTTISYVSLWSLFFSVFRPDNHPYLNIKIHPKCSNFSSFFPCCLSNTSHFHCFTFFSSHSATAISSQLLQKGIVCVLTGNTEDGNIMYHSSCNRCIFCLTTPSNPHRIIFFFHSRSDYYRENIASLGN